MTPIAGRVHLLRRALHRDGFAPDEMERGLERIEWPILRFVRRAGVLLDVSRVTTGKLRLDPVALDLGELMRDVVDQLSPLAEHAGATVQLDLPERGLAGAWDCLALEQILDNLITNALKFGDGKPVLVTGASEGTDRVRIAVHDNGAGIAPEDQERIFECFERVIAPGKTHAGLGVGLWLVRELAQAMNGSISVASAPNEGSTFTVSLPAKAVSPSATI